MNMALQQEYFVNEVLTAPPQKLQLMLIEAAIRNIQRARMLWQAGRDADAGEAVIKSQDIVTQLITGACPEEPNAVARQMRSIYLFIHRALVAAHMNRDDAKLGEALRVLEIERETWQQVCGKSAGGPPAPHFKAVDTDAASESSGGGFSFEA